MCEDVVNLKSTLKEVYLQRVSHLQRVKKFNDIILEQFGVGLS